MKNINAIVIVVIVAALLITAYDSFFVVNEVEQAVVTQFGKPVGEPIRQPGLKFKIPFIQKVRLFDKRVLKWDGEPNEIPTNDKTFIWVDTTARWRIIQPLTFLQRLSTPRRAQTVLNNLIDGAVRDLVTKNDLIEIILSSDWKKEYLVSTEGGESRASYQIKVGRDRFSDIIVMKLKDEMDKNGIELLDVLVKRINYTEKVREKVYERMISERNRIAAQLRSEGQGEKAKILGEMEKKLKAIRSEAFRQSEILRGEADATALQIYGKAYATDPDFFKFYSTLESYKETVGNNTKLILNSKSDLYRYLENIEAR